MSSETLLSQAEAHVVRLYTEHPMPNLAYHSLTHTREVARAAKLLAQHYKLPESQYLAVVVAAWFHDVGYLFSPADGHEEKGAELAAEFLQEVKASPELIGQAQNCIRATKLPQQPHNLLEEIVCDADLYHLGSPDYKDTSKLLRKERELVTDQSISGSDWRQGNIKFLSSHRYFTSYAQTLWNQGQEDNLNRLKEKQVQKGEKTTAPDAFEPIVVAPGPAIEFNPTPPSKDKDKKKDPERGIETMFRTTSANHLRLSEIADSKANIMISVNSIMVSVIVSVIPRRLEELPHLLIPTAIFLTTSLLTIIIAILATRPNVTRGTFSKDDIHQKKANLLFFGNFYNMTLEDYEEGINAMMHDSSFLYGSMTRDIYHLGVVLGRKYKLLRITYNIFMFGFCISILAFLYVFFFNEK